MIGVLFAESTLMTAARIPFRVAMQVERTGCLAAGAAVGSRSVALVAIAWLYRRLHWRWRAAR
jgi:hypothetical protein